MSTVKSDFKRMVEQHLGTTEEGYIDGYRNGYSDFLLGRNLVVAQTSTIPGYATGYYDGQEAARNGEPNAYPRESTFWNT